MSSRNERDSSTQQTASDWEEGNAVQVPQPPKGGDRTLLERKIFSMSER